MSNSVTHKTTLFAGLALLLTACGTLPPSDNTDTTRAGQTAGGANPNITGPAAGGTTTMPANPNATTDPNAMGNPNSANAKCADTWGNYAQAFFNGNCVGCHPTYTDYAKVMADSMIQAQISSGTMPKNATLAPADKARILNWIDCKEPQ